MSNTHVESEPRMPLVASDLLGALAENWWLLLLRGLAAIAFGLIAFFWPGITLVALTYLWGAYALVDGVVAIWAAFNASGGDAGPRWWLGLSGVVSILAGVVAFAIVQITASAPVLGQAMSTAPKAIESRPLNTSSHSFSITLRS